MTALKKAIPMSIYSCLPTSTAHGLCLKNWLSVSTRSGTHLRAFPKMVNTCTSHHQGLEVMAKTDIYKIKFNDGQFGKPENLGPPINSHNNEIFPFEDRNGTLFFSSDGHHGLGGLDLFQTLKEGNKVSIQNLGQPVNSSYDDFAIIFTDSINCYFSSNRPGGKGDDDIFECRYDGWKESKEVRYHLNGMVVQKVEEGEPMKLLPNSYVKMTDMSSGKVVFEGKTAENAQFLCLIGGRKRL